MESIAPWLALNRVPGLGPALYRRLLEQFGDPAGVFAATQARLTEVSGITEKLAARILKQGRCPEAGDELKRAGDAGFQVVTFNDPAYPQRLREIADPPPYLYVNGSLEGDSVAVAVVGSRNPTRYGVDVAGQLAADLAAKGIVVVSGMAAGIDTAAHTGALNGGGQTIAVLGSGLNRVYPAANRSLFEHIARSGAVISEFGLDAEPEAHHFPRRNRIISGMSMGTVVVEATRRSGSLITARQALDQNREVFAVPGSIHSFKSTGTHWLIKQGAKLIEHVQDILDELPTLAAAAGSPSAGDPVGERMPALDSDETRVAGALSAYPVHIDELSERLDMAAGRLAGIILQLELKGVVQQTPGNMVCLAPGMTAAGKH